MIKVLLALFVGLARRAAGARAGRRRARVAAGTGSDGDRAIQIVAILASCAAAARSSSSSCAAGGCSSATRCCGCSAPSSCSALAIWRGALDEIAELVGIAYPPNALFFIAFGFVLVLLLHFSVAVSRLADQSKVLAQRHALLEERLNRAGIEVPSEVAEGERREPQRVS